VARVLDGEVGRELDQVLAVAGRLGEVVAAVRAAREGVRGDGVERIIRGAVGGAAPAPDAAAASLCRRDAEPGGDVVRGEVDAVDAAHRRRVAVRRRRHVDGAVGERQRAPDELAPEVGEDAQRPADLLGAGLEVERVEAAEGVGDVEGVGLLVDRARAEDAVAVELPAARGELADVGAPAEAAVGGEGRDLAGRRRRVELAVCGEHLADDAPVERQQEVARQGGRCRAGGVAGAREAVAVGRPARVGRRGRGRTHPERERRAHDDHHPHGRAS
jgi:hypothetical protein